MKSSCSSSSCSFVKTSWSSCCRRARALNVAFRLTARCAQRVDCTVPRASTGPGRGVTWGTKAKEGGENTAAAFHRSTSGSRVNRIQSSERKQLSFGAPQPARAFRTQVLPFVETPLLIHTDVRIERTISNVRRPYSGCLLKLRALAGNDFNNQTYRMVFNGDAKTCDLRRTEMRRFRVRWPAPTCEASSSVFQRSKLLLSALCSYKN